MEITENTFDSEFFGRAIAKCVAGPEEFDPGKTKKMDNPQAWDLLVIESRSAQPRLEKYFVGELIELQGSLQMMRSTLLSIDARFSSTPLSDENWSEVRRLQQYAGQTRFSVDPHFTADEVINHKLKMLRIYRQEEPELALHIVAKGRFQGFQVSNFSEQMLNFYEVIVDPEHWGNFITLDLFRDVLGRALTLRPDCTKVGTKIYAGNRRSLGFFKRMGMKEVGRKYFYHLWA